MAATTCNLQGSHQAELLPAIRQCRYCLVCLKQVSAKLPWDPLPQRPCSRALGPSWRSQLALFDCERSSPLRPFARALCTAWCTRDHALMATLTNVLLGFPLLVKRIEKCSFERTDCACIEPLLALLGALQLHRRLEVVPHQNFTHRLRSTHMGQERHMLAPMLTDLHA